MSGTLVPDSGVLTSEVSGATVYAVGQQGSGTTTDANGNYTVTVNLSSASQIAVVQKPLLPRIVDWMKGEPKVATGFTQVGLVSISSTNAHGKKLNLNLQDGTAVNLPNITITTVGKITGNVTLQNGTDHTGIMVYIPGTSFLALTDASGNFTITNVPEGDYSYLRASISGYKHSMLSSITVASNATTTVRDQLLLIDTGATGSLLISGGAAVSANKMVNVNVAASSTAILMLYSESSIFLNAAWMPLQSSFSYTFDTEGAKTLYIKFADANGLESPVFSDSITINSNWTAPLTAPSTGTRTKTITPTFTWTADTLAAKYDLVISKNANLSTPDLTVTGIAAATYTLTASQALPASAEQLYYWSIRPVDSTGVTGSYATASNFTLDTTAPTVSSTTPLNTVISVANTSAVSAVFGEALDANLLASGTFTVATTAGSVQKTGAITYDSVTNTVTFTPSGGFPGTTQYTASLSTAIKDVAGNPLAALYSWNFTTAAGWVLPTGYSDHPSLTGGVPSYNPSVAMNALGDIVVAWAGPGETDNVCNGLCYNIYVASYKKSTRTWTVPTGITDHLNPLGRGAQEPAAAIDNAGNIVVIWRGMVVDINNSGIYKLYKAEYRNPGPGWVWTKPADMTAKMNPGLDTVWSVKIAMDVATGKAIIVWSESDTVTSNQSRIYYSYYDGAAWTAALLNAPLDPTATMSSYNPNVVGAGGKFVIAWYAWDMANGKNRIFAATYDVGTATMTAPLAAAYLSLAAQHGSNHAIAISQDGTKAMVTYTAANGASNQIYAATWKNATWTSPVNAADTVSPAGTVADWSKVDFDSTGKATVVWQQKDNTFLCNNAACNQIFRALWDGVAWVKPASLADNISQDGQHAVAPRISFDAAGNGIIVWLQTNGSAIRQVYKSEYRNGNPWTLPLLTEGISVNAATIEYQMTLDMSMGNDGPLVACGGGDAIILWFQKDNTTNCFNAACQQAYKAEYR